MYTVAKSLYNCCHVKFYSVANHIYSDVYLISASIFYDSNMPMCAFNSNYNCFKYTINHNIQLKHNLKLRKDLFEKNCINSFKVFKTQKVMSDGKIKLIDEGSSSCSKRIHTKIHLNLCANLFDSFSGVVMGPL